MPYIGNQPFGKTVRTVTTETIASAKTAYYPNGGYMAGYVDVFVNGVRLSESLDFTATDGSLVTLLYTPNIGDTVEIVTYGSVEIANAVRRSGDTFSGNVYVGSNVYISTSTISVGNATVNTQITAGNIALNGSTLTIGNSTVNTVFTGDTVTVGGTLSLGNSTITGTANVTTAINVGANVSMNATSIRVGNSTVNTYIVSDTIYGPSTLYIDPAAAGDNTGLVIVKGDLQVDGTTFTINSANVTVNDKNVVLASGAINNAATDGAGLTIFGTNANLTYNATGNNFEMSRGLSVTGTANVSVALNVGANVNLSTSQINVGNSTVNTTISATALTTTSNTVSIGTAAYFVANGNVGIGTSSPGSKFDILRSSTGTATFDESLIRAINTGAATLNQRVDIGMRFQDGTYNGIGGISMIRESATARSGGLSFSSIGSDGNPTNAMRLDSAGNLGVGVSSLAGFARLEIAGTAGDQTDAKQTLFVKAPTTTVGQGAGIRLSASSGAKEAVGVIGVINNATGNLGAMTFHVYNGGANVPEYMRLDNTGKLGIGTTPVATLDLLSSTNGVIAKFKSSSNYGTVVADNSSSTGGGSYSVHKNGTQIGAFAADGAIQGNTSADIAIFAEANNSLRFYTNGSATAKAIIAANGNIGIGTSSPTTLFHVAGTTNQASSMSSTSGTDAAIAANLSEIRPCSFNVDNSTNFVISNIVTTSTGWRAVFRGTWSNNYEGGALTPPPPYVEVNAANPSIIVGSRTLTVSRNGSGYLIVNSADSYRITFSGVVEIHQNPQSGQSNRSMQLLGGITFPATQSASGDANTLDDYEEGTWVVSVTPSASGSITLNTSINEMSYIKIGSMVTIFGRVLISSISSPSGSIRFNLPFAPETGLTDQSYFFALPIFTHDVNLNPGAVTLFGESSGSSVVTVYQVLDNSSWTVLPAGDLKGTNLEYFYMTGSYRAA